MKNTENSRCSQIKMPIAEYQNSEKYFLLRSDCLMLKVSCLNAAKNLFHQNHFLRNYFIARAEFININTACQAGSVEVNIVGVCILETVD